MRSDASGSHVGGGPIGNVSMICDMCSDDDVNILKHIVTQEKKNLLSLTSKKCCSFKHKAAATRVQALRVDPCQCQTHKCFMSSPRSAL